MSARLRTLPNRAAATEARFLLRDKAPQRFGRAALRWQVATAWKCETGMGNGKRIPLLEPGV
jgi:hypothetical protein